MTPSRTEAHNGKESQFIMCNDHDTMGLAGEYAFGEFSGLWPDTKIRKGGDGGSDFTIRVRCSVDIKTSRSDYLMHHPNKPFADIFVLAKYDDETKTAKLVGWESGEVLRKTELKEFKLPVKVHHIHKKDLRPMSELKGGMVLP